MRSGREAGQYAFLDVPTVQDALLDFHDGKHSRVTLQIPAMHCVACVWLLENLFHLRRGIGQSRVNFARRELSLTFVPEEIRLSEVAELLASLGYAPRLSFGHPEKVAAEPGRKAQWLKIGIAGFGFGNIMLFSLPLYLGLDSFSAPVFRGVFGSLSLLLALPVLVYSASDYWKSALLSVRTKVLTLDVPIALGLAALYGQSAWEILSRTGEGYLDSLAGLVFFLLCGRMFQQKTHDRILFDLDYKAFFPLAVLRRKGPEQVERGPSVPGAVSEFSHGALSDVEVGDHLLLRNGELIPADAILVSGKASIDYSFVTGEAQPVERLAGQHVYAGGKQVGESIEVRTVKPVSQSYLSSLWTHEAFRKQREDAVRTLTNRYSRRFTWIVVGVAVIAAVFWAVAGDVSRGLKAFTSVLIVACPCALALAAPFTLGTAQRILSRRQIFLKNAEALERMAQVDHVVFDKTGTLTLPWGSEVQFIGGEPLSAEEQRWVAALATHSTHPLSVAIARAMPNGGATADLVGFREVVGRGVSGEVEGRRLCLGSREWLVENGVHDASTGTEVQPGDVWLGLSGQRRGVFRLTHGVRPAVRELLSALNHRRRTTLLSGDSERDRPVFAAHFNDGLHFNQQPIEKLEFVRCLQRVGKTVLMVGDGLNDAGALKQSDVGVAVVEQTGSFSPASDIIMPAAELGRLEAMLGLASSAVKIVRLSFGISALYNAVGISIGAAGILSPVICAVLMPLSSVSVVLFACGATRRSAAKAGLLK